MSTTLGSLLSGRYRLDEQIGAGGMSRVYKAFDTLLERPVAIKTLNREVASESDQLERFRREARAVARLSHAHIVTVIDAGEDNNTPYIVFEYVEGETLKQRIRRLGRLEISEAIAYAIEIARALEDAHAHAIVHRDVKPQNVLIDPEGSAKITDFGIARTLTEEGLTADGRVLGTTDYVAPEQALGQGVTGQSDLYSLGIVLYEMLSGSVPFSAENQVAVAMKHVREELPDVQRLRPEISSELAALVDRATAKDLRRRYRDAPEMIADLEQVLATETLRSGGASGEATMVLKTLPSSVRRRVPLRFRSRVSVLLAFSAVLVAAALLIYLALAHTHRGTGPPPVSAAPPVTHQVPDQLGQDAANSYNIFGNTPEHPSTAGLAIDGDPGTAWTTFDYQGDYLQQKGGTGLYLDASPGIAATSIVVRTQTPGFDAQIWASNTVATDPSGPNSPSLAARGWIQVAGYNNVGRNQRIPLDTARQRFRYYLLWLTTLPPGSGHISINELALFYGGS